jgi:uncharacterized SAM-binding protein YcdF (DUF218 family)
MAVGLAVAGQASGLLLERLTYARHLPDPAAASRAVVYVLGGNPESLQAKFRTAARLLHEGKATRVLVRSDPSLMAFSPALERNPTVNEWMLEQLGALGVAAGKVELVAIEEGFFGTWSEARGVADLLGKRGSGRLILVTSRLHSRRAWESFSRATERRDVELFLHLSDEPALRRHVLTEWAKLTLYRVLLF